ncbi:MAG: acetyl-CoA synthetase, partial [bacterium]|nr:acetyl-CoA synthetase [bacterium]
MKKIIFLILLFSLIAIGAASDEARLLRYPDINGDLVAFVYAGDIWTVPAKGGEAKRLTSHKGLELFPKISPDKKWIAFSAEYSGSRQVYIIPTTGGNPKQLTYYNDAGAMPPRGGYDHVVLDWSPDSRKIMVRCNRTPFGRRKGKYFMVNIAGGLETPLPIPEGGFGSLSPDGKNVCFVQIGREFRTWKRYKGGMAADIWLYDLEKNNSRQITTFKGTDHHPSWYKNKIYFASDQNLILNMYSYDLATGKTEALTNHTEYDVMWPSGGNGMLVYENGGYLYILNLESGKEEKMTVYLHFDNPHIRAYHKNVSGNINNYDISPTGKRAVFDARGDIFTVPAKKGEIENLTQTQGIREISPRWSPDKKHIVYYSDATGEYEIYLIDKDGTTSPRQLTKNSSAWKYPAVWSPDSKKLLFSDKKQLLQILDIQSGKITAVDRASAYDIEYYRWSHDSKWIVYTKNGQNKQDAVWVYSLQEGKPHQLTNDTFIDFNPVFSTGGQYIFFLSNRDFNLTQSSFENDFLYCKATKIFALPLKKDTTPLFIDRNDTEDLLEQASPKSGKSTKGVKENHGIAIDYKDCDRRIQAFLIANVGTLYPSPTTGLFSYLD